MKAKFVGWVSARRPDLMPRGYSLQVVLWVVIIVLLLILPSILHRYPSYDNLEKIAQLDNIDAVLEFFKAEFGYYPPSDAKDNAGIDYCGAMKLSEVVMGQDLMGVHPDSIFRRDGTDGKGAMLYPDANDLSKEAYRENLSIRTRPYLPIDNANACRLRDLYQDVGPFSGNEYVLCNVYSRVTHIGSGKRVGMPILYYKARASKTAHDVNDPNNPENIYDYRDNHALLALGVPGKPGMKHPLFENPKIFYEMTRDYRTTGPSRPFRADTFILLSAGWDGLYGTQDDVANFEMRWKPK